MQTSAKIKAKEFMYQNRKLFSTNTKTEVKGFKVALEILLKEHERDTCYAMVDNVNSLDTYEVEVYNQEFMGLSYTSGLVLSDVESCIKNLKVGK